MALRIVLSKVRSILPDTGPVSFLVAHRFISVPPVASSMSSSHASSALRYPIIRSSSTALGFVRALRRITDVTRLSTIVSIYQAGEPLYELFDKVCLIYEGRMASMLGDFARCSYM